MINANSAAYPIEARQVTFFGLSKRELFAAMAMQGHLTAEDSLTARALAPEELARSAVACADALLAALEKS